MFKFRLGMRSPKEKRKKCGNFFPKGGNPIPTPVITPTPLNHFVPLFLGDCAPRTQTIL